MNHTTNETEIPEMEIDGVDIIFIPGPAAFRAIAAKYRDTGEMFIFVNANLPEHDRNLAIDKWIAEFKTGDWEAKRNAYRDEIRGIDL
jgi:hypothetical protein